MAKPDNPPRITTEEAKEKIAALNAITRERIERERAEPPTTEVGASFDSVAVAKHAERTFQDLGEYLTDNGLEYSDLPATVWKSATAALKMAKNLDEEYRAERDPEKQKEIAAQMQKVRDRLEGSITKSFEKVVHGPEEKMEREARAAAKQKAGERSAKPKHKKEIITSEEEFNDLLTDVQHRLPVGEEPVPEEMKLVASIEQGKIEHKDKPKEYADFVEIPRSETAIFAEMEREKRAIQDKDIDVAGLSVEKQIHQEESNESLAEHGYARPEDVTVSGFRAPQYARATMQKDMNSLKGDAEFAADSIKRSGLDLDLSEPAPAVEAVPIEVVPVVAEESIEETPEKEETSTDFTRKESRDKLRQLILDAEKKEMQTNLSSVRSLETVREALGVGERAENLKEYGAHRIGELDTEAKKVGGLEGKFRSWGKSYNKFGFIKKLGIGIGLGVGAALTSGPAFGLCLALVAGQRIAGMAGAFVNIEKRLQDKKGLLGKKETAMGMAAVWSVGMGYAISEVIDYAQETEMGKMVFDYWKDFFHKYNPFGHAEVPVTQATPHETAGTIRGITSSEIQPPEASVVIPPELSMNVEAAQGHGYEYMMKRMWDGLQEAKSEGLDVSKYTDPNSDIYKLLHANAKSINDVVHEIAKDPKHGFFNPDGTNVRIDPSAHMTFVNGQLHLADATHPDMVHAASDMGTTPVYHPYVAPVVPHVEAPAPVTYAETPTLAAPVQPVASIGVPAEQAPAPVFDASPKMVENPVPGGNGGYLVDSEGHLVTTGSGLPVETGPYPETPVVSHAEMAVPTPLEPTPMQPLTGEGHFTAGPVEATEVTPPPAPTPPPHIEAPTPAVEINPSEPVANIDLTHEQDVAAEKLAAAQGGDLFTNGNGVPVNSSVAEIYGMKDVSGKEVLVGYGGKGIVPSDLQAQKYAIDNKTSVFVDKSFRTWLGGVTKRVVEYTADGKAIPHDNSNLVIDPKTFTKLAK